jgi:hypothetical protein
VSELTWEDLDRFERDRQAKVRECVERLSKILVKEFTVNELKLIWNYGGIPSPIIVEAFEIARLKARG